MNKRDIIKMDVPLFIRLLEYAKEDAESDMDLHKITEKIIDLSQNIENNDLNDEEIYLTMNHYDDIVDIDKDKSLEESFRMKKLAGIIK